MCKEDGHFGRKLVKFLSIQPSRQEDAKKKVRLVVPKVDNLVCKTCQKAKDPSDAGANESKKKREEKKEKDQKDTHERIEISNKHISL